LEGSSVVGGQGESEEFDVVFDDFFFCKVGGDH
jgi:hypothetical protein